MTFSQDAYLEALRFAAEKHRGQTIPGTGLPYVVHLTSVAMEVMASFAKEPAAEPDLAVQCALLHDTLEDTEATYEEVADRFGHAVADGVMALTKNASLDKDARMPDSLSRLRAQPEVVQRVKLADRITNLQRPPFYWDETKKRRYREEARLIHAELGASSAFLAARLGEKIEAYVRYVDQPATGPRPGPDVLDRLVRSIEALHAFFVVWFSGAEARDDRRFAEHVTARLDPDFTLIPPRGVVLQRAELEDGIRSAHGSNPDFRIQIRNVRTCAAESGLVVATYEEWQRNARASTPPDNGRVATVVAREDPGAPEGLRWLRVHETWLPPEVMAAEPFDF